MKLLTFAHQGEAQVFIKNDLYNPLQSSLQGLFKNNHQYLLVTGEGLESVKRKMNAVLTKYGDEISLVINLGIAGALDQNLELGSIYSVRNVYTENSKQFFTATDIQAKYDCVSANQRVLDKNYAARLMSIAQIVDRELWACAEVCHKYEIPFSSLKIISDFTGSVTNTYQIIKNAKCFSKKLYECYYNL